MKVGGIVEVTKRHQRFVLVCAANIPGRTFIEIPRGKVESGSLMKNILREVWEETGLRCKVVQPFIMNYYAEPKLKYCDIQLYYILRPLGKVDIKHSWNHTDSDPDKRGKRIFTCWFMPVAELKLNRFHTGQSGIMRAYLKSFPV